MWPFSSSILRKTEGNDERTQREYRACIVELRKIDRALRDLEKRAPHAHGKALNALQTQMLVEERVASETHKRLHAMTERIESYGHQAKVAMPQQRKAA